MWPIVEWILAIIGILAIFSLFIPKKHQRDYSQTTTIDAMNASALSFETMAGEEIPERMAQPEQVEYVSYSEAGEKVLCRENTVGPPGIKSISTNMELSSKRAIELEKESGLSVRYRFIYKAGEDVRGAGER